MQGTTQRKIKLSRYFLLPDADRFFKAGTTAKGHFQSGQYFN